MSVIQEAPYFFRKKGDLPLITKKLGTVYVIYAPLVTPAYTRISPGQMFMKITFKNGKSKKKSVTFK